MVIMEMGSGPDDLTTLWRLLAELAEQLTKTRTMASTLRSQSDILKQHAVNAETGFVLHRFNTHLTQEEYDTELERMIASMSNDNLVLQHDNKQLGALLKEYEQTVEKVMSKFRHQAHDVQEHELGLIRQFESLLLDSESKSLEEQLAANTAVSLFVERTSRLLRPVIRIMLNGEEPEPPATPPSEAGGSSSSVIVVRGGDTLAGDVMDWALERECELARLEKENGELLWLVNATSQADTNEPPRDFPRLQLPDRGSFSHFRRTRTRGRGSGVGVFRHYASQHGVSHEALHEIHDIGDDFEHPS